MAAPRPYWKGYLKLSLVTCPVALYPASSRSEKTHFHQINRKTGHRLRQQMVDEVTGEPVDKDDRARGYEVAEDRYVEIAPDDLEAIQVKSTHTLDIDTFVPADQIDKRYYERPYYMVPDKKTGEEAFVVIRDAMKNKNRLALGRLVFANREHIVAIEPWGKGMLCTSLRYDYEVRPESDVFDGISSPHVSKEMIDLAAHILDNKTAKFDPSQFKDEYELALRDLVQRKAAGKTIERTEPRAARSNVIDLMSALRESVEGSRRTAPTQRTGKAGRTRARVKHRRTG